MQTWLPVIGTIAGSGLLVAIVQWLAGRGKAKVDTAAVLIEQALAQATRLDGRYDRLEARHDALEGEVRDFRRSIAPHQQWDAEAYQAALRHNPDFRPPPDLVI